MNKLLSVLDPPPFEENQGFTPYRDPPEFVPLLGDTYSTRTAPSLAETVGRLIAKDHRVPFERMLRPGRVVTDMQVRASEARAVFFARLREMGWSLSAIASLAGMHRTSVLYVVGTGKKRRVRR